ncbi:metallo-beta-lactamase superfamily protein [Macrophomina phaseolina]|uniref:Metallo-beta-lactamase superfamily protein n=1 Tax=Macrophomina phaseolina TaxID=35725 RepID=A0ABQ8GJP1_9PEZI|nr:metallo-beta-lactamase superfamily protein [Macrophomina phaseolina]
MFSPKWQPIVPSYFEHVTKTWKYIIPWPQSKYSAKIDPVLDFDPANTAISTTSADMLLSGIAEDGYIVQRILETHAHADHITAAQYLKTQLRKKQKAASQACIGKGITSRNSFDCTFTDGETFSIGKLEARVLHLPGHTPDHVGSLIGENVFCGDSILNPDIASARTDFPQGSANILGQSVRKLLSLHRHFRLYTGHVYPPADRIQDGDQGGLQGQPRPFAAIEEHRHVNRHVKDGTSEEDFVRWRQERDASLGSPRLLHHSLQFNIRAGKPPRPSLDGTVLLRMPLKIPETAFSRESVFITHPLN